MKFRLSGVPLAQAIKSIAIENSEFTVKDLHQEAENQFNLNPLLNYKYIYKGKVLSDFTRIAELNLRPSDVITVMAEQAGAGSFTTNQFKMLTELYRIMNPKSKGKDIDIQKIGEFLQRTLKVRKEFVQDLTNYPKDLNIVLELLYYCETQIKDNAKISQIRNTIENFVVENIDYITDSSRELFKIFSEIAIGISKDKGKFTDFDKLTKGYLKGVQVDANIIELLKGNQILTSKDLLQIDKLIKNYLTKTERSNIINNLYSQFSEFWNIKHSDLLKLIHFPENLGDRFLGRKVIIKPIDIILYNEELFNILDSKGIRYNKERTIGIIRELGGIDPSKIDVKTFKETEELKNRRKVVWLELGNIRDGMIKILNKHFGDFQRENYNTYEEIIRLILSNMYNHPYILDKGSQVYKFMNKEGKIKYLRVRVAPNGFITNAYIMNRISEINRVESQFELYFE